MGQNTIRLFLATGKEQPAPSKMWSHLIKGTSALPVVLSEDIVRRDLIMMFMEIISLKIIIGHREQRDGDINHVMMTHKLIPYQLMHVDDKSDSVHWLMRQPAENSNVCFFFSSPFWKLTHYPTLFCFISYFFIKRLECRGEASSKAHP